MRPTLRTLIIAVGSELSRRVEVGEVHDVLEADRALQLSTLVHDADHSVDAHTVDLCLLGVDLPAHRAGDVEVVGLRRGVGARLGALDEVTDGGVAGVSRFARAQSRRTARIVNMYFGMASVLLPSRRRPFASPSKLCGAESSVASAAPEMTAARRAEDDPTFTGS